MSAVLDVILRLGIAAVAGATMRMLVVLGVPWPVAFAGLVAVSAVVSWRLVASRIFAVLLVSAGYFVTYLMTQSSEVVAEALEDNPPILELARNAALLCMPFALPALGSMISLVLEKRQDKRAKDQEVITEESLLAEHIPSVPPGELDYDLRNIEESRL
jgi:hypothetical protein